MESVSSAELCQSEQKKGVAISIDDGGADLQARFEMFRKNRIRARQAQRDRGEKTQVSKQSSAAKARLRASFVERALSYIGAPYHRRYFPDLPEDTLFLDCCGLVRRVLRDLAPDFGFLVGGWNQAYQLDTLPTARSRDELVPGDLVFWSGDFLNPRHKAYKFNCVHVEIYLGSRAECQEKLGLDVPQLEGVPGTNATLGSRTAGRVQVHETFENKPSTLYTVTDVFFRSIDEWLGGVCEPRQYAWGNILPHAGTTKRATSIFADEGAESENEEAEPECTQVLPSAGGS